MASWMAHLRSIEDERVICDRVKMAVSVAQVALISVKSDEDDLLWGRRAFTFANEL
jgi:hypothetical protein